MKTHLMIGLIACLLSILAVLIHALANRDRLHSVFLNMLYVAVGVYLFGYILELMGDTLEAALPAIYVQNFGIVLIGPSFLIFMLTACNSKRYRRWMVYAAGVYSLLTYVGVLTTGIHGLYYTAAQYVPVRDMHYVSFSYGPLFYLHQGVTAACCIVGCVVPLRLLKRWNTRIRRCMTLLVVGALVALLTNFVHLSDPITRQVDFTPIFLTVILLICHWSISRNKMFNITGIASETAIQAMDDGVIILDSRWGYQFSNQSAQRLFPGLGNLSATDSVSGVADWPTELSGNTVVGNTNFNMPGPDGKKHYYHARVSAVGNAAAPMGWSIVIRDITESIVLLEQMQALAVTDSLTGVFNRRYFMESAQRQMDIEAREQQMSAMIFFDIDHFKVVNDTYGHQTGDIVLRMVADTVSKELRSYDLFSRYGGEEFAVYVINIKFADAEKLAWRLCRAVENLTIRHQGEDIRVTASFGVAEVRWESSLEDALNAADAAMYRAKSNGRNRVELTPAGTPIQNPVITDRRK